MLLTYFPENLIFLCPLVSNGGNVNNLKKGESLTILETGTVLLIACEKWSEMTCLPLHEIVCETRLESTS